MAKQNIKIFDLGSNTFTQTSNLIEEIGEKGAILEVHTFEAQKDLALDNLEKLKKDYPAINFYHNNVAAWIKNTTLNFYEPKNWGPNYKGGASLIRHTPSLFKDAPIPTPAIDFVKYFDDNSSLSTYNFIKMDIEGAEYKILPKLVVPKLIPKINRLACEYHLRMYSGPARMEFSEIHTSLLKKIKASPITTTPWH